VSVVKIFQADFKGYEVFLSYEKIETIFCHFSKQASVSSSGPNKHGGQFSGGLQHIL
jgi:hypothetical protein